MFPCLVVSALILGLSCVLTLCWVSAGCYPSEEFGKRAKLNEGHVKAAIAYKARVVALTSERAEL